MNKDFYGVCTSRLFARPSLKSGAGRILDIAGTFDISNTSQSSTTADYRALSNDWAVVGSNLGAAIQDIVALNWERVKDLPEVQPSGRTSEREKASAGKR
jgi:hypothetical protein